MLYIGIPVYQETERLQKTIAAIRGATSVPFELDIQIHPQSVVKNKNAILERARASSAEFVVICDDDVEPEAHWFEMFLESVRTIESKTGLVVGQIAPRLILPEGHDFALWFNADLGSAADSAWVRNEIESLGQIAHPSFFVLRPAAVAGTFSMFRRTFLEATAWKFDERYERSQWEDVDQSLACRHLGFEVVYDSRVRMTHHISGTSPRALSENYALLLQKWQHHQHLSRTIKRKPVADGIADGEYVLKDLKTPRPGKDDLMFALRAIKWSPKRSKLIFRGAMVFLKYGLWGSVKRMRQHRLGVI